MKTIKMLRTEKGSQDGVKIEEFKRGSIVTVDSKLAEIFVDQLKCSEYVGIEKPPENSAQKSESEIRKAFKRTVNSTAK
jgi:hypothetical protein